MAEGDGSERRGSQWIPRPPRTRDGDRPDWAHLDPEDRRFTLPEDHGEAHVILTKRPQTMPTHRGEIAFPGGKRDTGDPTLLAAALREAHEEIGLRPETVEVVAELDSLNTVASQFTITPFVGV